MTSPRRPAGPTAAAPVRDVSNDNLRLAAVPFQLLSSVSRTVLHQRVDWRHAVPTSCRFCPPEGPFLYQLLAGFRLGALLRNAAKIRPLDPSRTCHARRSVGEASALHQRINVM